MTLKEYAAQNKQDTQEVEQENTLDAVARQLQAAEAEKKMLSLSEQLQNGLDNHVQPALILQQLTGAIFGTDSPQAVAMAAAIKATEERPVALEMRLACIRAQRAVLKRKHKQQADALATTEKELDTLAEEERLATQRSTAAAGFDECLADALTFYKVQQLEVQPGALDDLEIILDRCAGSAAAVPVLHSCLLYFQRENAAGRVQFDLSQLEQLARLLQRTAGK